MRFRPLARPRLAVTLLAALALVPGPAVAATATDAVAARPPSYSLEVLEPLSGGTSSIALGLSSRSVTVGTSRTGSGFRPQVAVRWQPGRLRTWGPCPAPRSAGRSP